jgi:hypothetical protein
MALFIAIEASRNQDGSASPSLVLFLSQLTEGTMN